MLTRDECELIVFVVVISISGLWAAFRSFASKGENRD